MILKIGFKLGKNKIVLLEADLFCFVEEGFLENKYLKFNLFCSYLIRNSKIKKERGFKYLLIRN